MSRFFSFDISIFPLLEEKIAGVTRLIKKKKVFWSTQEERNGLNGSFYLPIFPLGVMRGFESLVITSRQWPPLSPMKDVISVVILQIRHVRFLLLNEMNSLLLWWWASSPERNPQRIFSLSAAFVSLQRIYFQNPSTYKFQTFPPPSNRLISSRNHPPPSFLLLFFSHTEERRNKYALFCFFAL